MKKTILSLLLASLFCFLSGPAAAEKILIAACDPWPPFVDPQHPKEGVSMEIIRAAYATQGYAIKLEYVPWARAEQGVKDGVYDFLPPTWMTHERQKYLLYSEPYAVNQIKFIKRKDDPFEFTGMESLKGKTIGIVRGYGYGDAFLTATHFRREEANDLISNTRKLIAGRIDLTLEDEIVARVRLAQENPNLLNDISFTRNALSRNPLHIAAGLKNPKHQEIITAFNKGLAEIRKNGTYAAILASYGIESH
ncbi:substrate-binding periplasmic protein [Desulfobotulus sp.]|uniref:substrate-binding periplasmic protein n=1 Tax=Desulfobotulus sp. TaxID=1940337 RepID=UPI002A36A0A4|nr:transporter substrate-binding domain-containing protein [Desulfobotulus sp.]MDY0162613.1 transporter substrate-binding domain-containing protein [Desulfobotulus sp.]